MSRGCRRRSRRSRITSGPTISTGCRCFATRCSSWTTSTCRCSRRRGGSLRLGVTLMPSSRRSIRRCCCWPLAAVPTVATSTWRPGVERQAQERGAPGRRVWPGISSRRPRHRPRARRSASPGSATVCYGTGVDAWERWYGPVSRARSGSAVWHTLAWAVFGARLRRGGGVRGDRVSVRRPRRSCWFSPRGRVCRRMSARRWGRSGSCGASGWTARGDWPGWRTTRRRRWRTGGPGSSGPTARRASGSSMCRSPIRAPTGWFSTTSRWRCRPAPSSRWWGRTAPARRRS